MSEIVMIPVCKLFPHPDNPRKNIGDVTELANSIKAKGVLQNLTVVPNMVTGEITGETWQRGYKVIIGHRRLAAAKLAGLTEVPCVVADLSPREQFDTMMVENVQRADLTIFEQAQGFQMMLDMGGTVESVAEQTGFSETTVRNRLKLMKLDQTKLQQSMEREATLSDYMELDKIEDTRLRNKVLESIGTPNFRTELAQALQKEKTRRKIAEWEALVSSFAEKVEKQDSNTMVYVLAFGPYNDPGKKGWTPPEDATTAKYYYRIDSTYGVYLYKEKVVDVTEEERKKQEKAAEQAEYDRKKNEFEEISDRHYALRNAFIMEFGASKKYATAITQFALQAIVHADSNWGDIDWQLIADMLDIRMDDEQEKVDPIEYAEAIKRSPEYALLVTAYAYISDEDDDYWGWHWDNGKRVFYRDECEELDLIYKMLTQLGYEMSDEEIAMQKGTHELFEYIPTDEDDEDEFDEDLEDYDDLDEEDDE